MTTRLALMAITSALLAAPGTASAEVTDWNRSSCCAAGTAASAPLRQVVVVVVVVLIVGIFALGVVRSEGPEERDTTTPTDPGARALNGLTPEAMGR
jgi:hypothetical protein